MRIAFDTSGGLLVNGVGLKHRDGEDVLHCKAFSPLWLPSQVQTTDVVIFQLNLQTH